MTTPEDCQGGSQRELPGLAVAAVVLALLAVVGLASSVSVWHAPHRATAPTTVLHGLAVSGGIVLIVALLLFWVETPSEPAAFRKRRKPVGDEFDQLGASMWTAAKTAAIALLAVAIVCFAALPLLSRAPAPTRGLVGLLPSKQVATPRSQEGSPGHSVDVAWLLVPFAVTLTVLTPAAAVIRRRRVKRVGVIYSEEPAVLLALRASMAALESEPDPGKAILRAYQRMEQAFRQLEIARARDETASEFLTRTMRRLPTAAGAAAGLTDRFETVRYSTHQITEADRASALASLQEIERELQQQS